MTFPVDLHVHSLASDGRESPLRVLEHAAESGVRFVSFADHSVATWSEELLTAANALGVELPFPAMEVSAYNGARKHHIVLYGHAVLDDAFASYCAHPIEMKNAVYQAAVETLRTGGVEIPSFEVILAGAGLDGPPRHPYKRLGSRTLIAEYVARATGEPLARARERVVAASSVEIEDDRVSAMKKTHLPAREVIERGRRLGAFVVLAHPLWECGRFGVDIDSVLLDIAEFASAGLHGIETSSYHHPSPGESEELLKAISRYGLVKSGGSDYHANGRTMIGERGLSWDEWENLRICVARLAA